MCEISPFSTPDKVENGELVITSGQDGIYPRGLLVGRLRKPDERALALGQAYEVEPAAQFGKLEIVSVLIVPPGQIRQAIDDIEIEEKKLEKTLERNR